MAVLVYVSMRDMAGWARVVAPVAGVDEGWGGWEGYGEGFVRVWEGIGYAGE